MRIERLSMDDAVLTELGSRLARCRIEQGLTQAKLAEQAGVSKRTVERIEAGNTTQTVTLIRILRELHLLERLETLLPETRPSPMALLQLKGKERKRAPRKRAKSSVRSWQWSAES